MKQGEFLEGEAGVPQGGIISPTIANMVLDGLQGKVQDATKHLRTKKGKVVKVVTVGTRKKKIYRKAEWSPKVNVVRYRDDFVVTAATKRILEVLVKPVVNEFLESRGLQLNETKTTIVNVKQGFDFLGYNFRIYPYSKRVTGYIALTKPTKKGYQRLIDKIKKVVTTQKDAGTIIME